MEGRIQARKLVEENTDLSRLSCRPNTSNTKKSGTFSCGVLTHGIYLKTQKKLAFLRLSGLGEIGGTKD